MTVVEDASYPAGTVNRFEITMAELRPNLYMVTWTEPATGNTVTHIEDYETRTDYTTIVTPLLEANLDAPTTQALANMHALKRLGQPGEVAALVCFLASDDASCITGSYHLVDGGYSAQ